MMEVGERVIACGADLIPTLLPLDEIGVGQMLSWNPNLKRSLFGSWMDRRPAETDPADLSDLSAVSGRSGLAVA